MLCTANHGTYTLFPPGGDFSDLIEKWTTDGSLTSDGPEGFRRATLSFGYVAPSSMASHLSARTRRRAPSEPHNPPAPHLCRRFAAWTAVPQQFPAGMLCQDFFRAQTLILTVVPFHQVRIDFRHGSEPANSRVLDARRSGLVNTLTKFCPLAARRAVVRSVCCPESLHAVSPWRAKYTAGGVSVMRESNIFSRRPIRRQCGRFPAPWRIDYGLADFARWNLGS